MSPPELNGSGAPLTEVYQRVTGHSPALLTLIAIFAVINGALVQLIMVSRLLYGMGKRTRPLRLFAAVSPRTRTPIVSTVTVSVLILVLALWLPVRSLAEYTSTLVLVVFVLVNASLIAIKRVDPVQEGVRSVPFWIPVAGVLTTLPMLLYVCWRAI
jgi:amino acid transporter